MHSLKNTAIAVILLGLSFGLYQISLTPAPEIDPSQTPAIDISEGLSQLSSPPLNSPPLGALPAKLDAPQLPATKPDPLVAANAQLPNAGSLDIASHFPKAPTTPIVQPTLTPKTIPPRNTPPATPANQDRVPVVSTTQNNIQSIQYPEKPNSGKPNSVNDFASATSPPAQPAIGGPTNPSSAPGAQIAQRELVNPTRDQGLINALQTNPTTPDNSFGAGGNSFVANPTPLRPSSRTDR